jgi:hypothetical protein
MITNNQRTAEDMEGGSRCPDDVLSRNLTGRLEEKARKPAVMTASVGDKIPIEHIAKHLNQLPRLACHCVIPLFENTQAQSN